MSQGVRVQGYLEKRWVAYMIISTQKRLDPRKHSSDKIISSLFWGFCFIYFSLLPVVFSRNGIQNTASNEVVTVYGRGRTPGVLHYSLTQIGMENTLSISWIYSINPKDTNQIQDQISTVSTPGSMLPLARVSLEYYLFRIGTNGCLSRKRRRQQDRLAQCMVIRSFSTWRAQFRAHTLQFTESQRTSDKSPDQCGGGVLLFTKVAKEKS